MRLLTDIPTSEELESSDVPEGWALAELGALVKPSIERAEPKECPAAPYLSLEHIESGTGRILGHGLGADVTSTKTVFRAGDVLYGKLRPYLNKVCIPGFDGICSTDILVFPQTSHLVGQYLRYFLSRPDTVEFANHHMAGVELPRVSFGTLAELQVAVPPLAEQRRIVAQVDMLLARVSLARERFTNVSTLVEHFRKAVLRAAFSGALTAEWRQQHAQPRTMEGQQTSVDHAFQSTSYESNARLGDIPAEWEWVRLPEVGELNRGKSRHRPRDAPHLYGGSYPFIQTGDIAQSGGRITRHRQTYSEAGLEQSRIWPTGTVAITIAANIANSAVLTYPACFPDSVVGFVPKHGVCTAEYIEFFIRTAREDLADYAPATAQKNINLEILREVQIPLAPISEQQEVVSRIDALFALADAVEHRVETSMHRADRLSEAIVEKAFRGQLVPTEAELARQERRDYEPATMLLKRIREEMAPTTSRPRVKGRQLALQLR